MEPFIGEIKAFGGNFAPRGYAFCSGQLLSINENQALFSILGTTYGGDGRTTFGLPDLRGRSPMHAGNGPGLTPRALGSKLGTETNILHAGQLPAHNHGLAPPATNIVTTINAVSEAGDSASPEGTFLANSGARDTEYRAMGTPAGMNVNAATSTISGFTGNAGSSQPVNNLQPIQVINLSLIHI